MSGNKDDKRVEYERKHKRDERIEDERISTNLTEVKLLTANAGQYTEQLELRQTRHAINAIKILQHTQHYIVLYKNQFSALLIRPSEHQIDAEESLTPPSLYKVRMKAYACKPSRYG